MNKTELLKLVESINDEDSVLETLKGVEGLSSPFDATKISVDDYKSILEKNSEVKGYYKSSFDSAVGTAVDNHDKKFMKEKFPQLVEEEIKKRSNEGKSELEIKFEEEVSKREVLEKQINMEKLSNKYTKVLADKGLPLELKDFILGDGNEETIDSNIEKFTEIINTAVTKGINSKITENPPIPERGQGLSKPQDAFVKALGL